MKKSIGLLVLGLILVLTLTGCVKREGVKEEIPMDIITGDSKSLHSSGFQESDKEPTKVEIEEQVKKEIEVKKAEQVVKKNDLLKNKIDEAGKNYFGENYVESRNDPGIILSGKNCISYKNNKIGIQWNFDKNWEDCRIKEEQKVGPNGEIQHFLNYYKTSNLWNKICNKKLKYTGNDSKILCWNKLKSIMILDKGEHPIIQNSSGILIISGTEGWNPRYPFISESSIFKKDILRENNKFYGIDYSIMQLSEQTYKSFFPEINEYKKINCYGKSEINGLSCKDGYVYIADWINYVFQKGVSFFDV